jgi:DUF1365 family protein
MSTAPLIWTGRVRHQRLSPRRHAFAYPVIFISCDVDCADGPPSSRLLAFNRAGLFSLRSRDYLSETAESFRALRGELERWLPGIGSSDERVHLFTGPRLFGYAFTPISVFLCAGPQGELTRALVEVRNTFGEKHVYPLLQLTGGGATIAKEFFVSPFFGVDGCYEFSFSLMDNQFNLTVRHLKDEQLAFVAHWSGVSRQFSPGRLLQAWITRPLSALLAYPRIVYQAWYLQRVLKLTSRMRPWATHERTLIKAHAGRGRR